MSQDKARYPIYERGTMTLRGIWRGYAVSPDVPYMRALWVEESIPTFGAEPPNTCTARYTDFQPLRDGYGRVVALMVEPDAELKHIRHVEERP